MCTSSQYVTKRVINVMASLTKTFVSPDIVLQNLEAITACSSWTKACTETTWSSVVLWTVLRRVALCWKWVFVCCQIASRMSTGHPSGTRGGPAPSARGPALFGTPGDQYSQRPEVPSITVNPKDPKNLADFEDLQSPASGSPSPRPQATILLAQTFLHTSVMI